MRKSLGILSSLRCILERGTHDLACGPREKKRGVVVGAYDECGQQGEYKLTPTGCRLNSLADDKIVKYLKKTDLSKRGVLLLSQVCPDVDYVAVARLGSEEAGCSDSECLDEAKENARVAAGLGARELQLNDVEEICVESFGNVAAAAEGAILSTWSYEELKDRETRHPEPFIALYDDPDATSWRLGKEMADAQNLVRKLEETPANILKPSHFAETALKLLCPLDVHVDIRDEDWLEEKQLSGFLAMSKGSCEPPLLLEMSYCGGGEGDRPIVLVGKGVTFDSGGLDLKPHRRLLREGSMGLAGAAVLVGVIWGLATLRVPITVNALVPLCENMPGGRASRPGDVVRSHSGRSVLVERTENEGELLLADALSLAQGLDPCLVISVAALCNSLRGTLGSPATGAFASTNSCWLELARAAASTGDRVWRLPLWKAYSAYVTKHKSVDVANVGVYPGGDPCTSAAFLKEFSGCSSFLHLDLSGTGGVCYDDCQPYLRPRLKTGRPTRTVLQLLYQIACPQDSDSARK